jgi:AcrR family transcriptional regulator
MTKYSREKSASKKRSAILTTGFTLMMKHGIERISVDEICRKAGVSKMTFYKYFTNKQALMEAIFKEQVQIMESRIDAIRKSDLSNQEKIKAFIRLKLDQTAPMSWDFIKELQSTRNLEWMNALKDENEKILHLFLDDLKEKQASGEIRTNVSPETFFYAIDRIIEWEADEKFIRRFVTIEALSTEILNFLFYGFLGAREGTTP